MPCTQKMMAIRKYNLISNFSWTGSINNESCYPCAIGKSHVTPCNKHVNPPAYSDSDTDTEFVPPVTQSEPISNERKRVSQKSRKINTQFISLMRTLVLLVLI